MRFAAPFLALVTLFSAVALATDLSRPPPKGSSPQASAVSVARYDGESPGAAYLRALPPEERKTLDKEGQVLLEDDKSTDSGFGGYIRAVAIFHQSKKRVFELMAAPDQQSLFMPHVVSSVPMQKPANGQLTEFTLKVMLSHYRFHTMHWFYPETSRLEWWLDTSQKNDIAGQEGYWQLFELTPDTTVGEYGTKIDTGIHVPKWLQNIFARGDIPDALKAFRKYMDSNGTWRKD
jgi:hypothetical protein